MREEIRNFTWVLYDREKTLDRVPRHSFHTNTSPLPPSLFFLHHNPLLPSADPSKPSSACLLACLPVCHVGRPLPPRTKGSLPRSSSSLSVTQAFRETIPCRQDLGCFLSDLEPSCFGRRPRPGPLRRRRLTRSLPLSRLIGPPPAFEMSPHSRKRQGRHATKNQDILRLLSVVVQTRPVLGLELPSFELRTFSTAP